VNTPINVVILAAGLGTRMKSQYAKALHKIGGRTLLGHLLNTSAQLNPDTITVVVGYQADLVEQAARAALDTHNAEKLRFAVQAEQRGTGHAVSSAKAAFQNQPGVLIVLYVDAPLVQADTLRQLVETHVNEKNSATLLTTKIDPPPAFGRIVRDEVGNFQKIVEQKDCTPEQRALTEVNPGFYCFEIADLLPALEQLQPNNTQGEYYLTDVPEILLHEGKRVGTAFYADYKELAGLNDRVELAEIGQRLRERTLRRLMLDGVTIVDPNSTYIDDTVVIGRDTIIHPQVIIEGASRIGSNCEIHSWSHLTNAEIGDECKLLNGCIIVDSKLNGKNSVGPYAHLRMHTELAEEAVIGNFVEAKKSKLGRKTKSMHLTYLGDATLGDRVNIGAGTITCNYDGKNKNPTFIGDDVKIGSDTMLVAPVKVGRGAMSGAGSVITKDVPEDTLVAGVPAQVKKKLKA
jgi:bifunctional UDP-N-acetylglucosamine pyrophosphorylase / glucosamine-1-phosphate N-acetyltransferase